MKAKKINEYSKNGRVVKVYEITSATPEQLHLYAEIQGDYYRVNEENQRPLFFYREDFAPNELELQFNRDKTGVYVTNNSVQKIMSATERLRNTALGNAFAQLSAQHLFAQLTGVSAPSAVAVAETTPVASAVAMPETNPFTEESGE